MNTQLQFTLLGNNISAVEVSHISQHGLWLWLDDKELLLPFTEFPWFQHAPLSAVFHIERPQAHHLYWPDLDVDLTV